MSVILLDWHGFEVEGVGRQVGMVAQGGGWGGERGAKPTGSATRAALRPGVVLGRSIARLGRDRGAGARGRSGKDWYRPK
jgi:hypothetical protein